MSMSSKIYIAYIEVRQVSAIDSRASHSAYFRGLLSPVADLIGESPRPPPTKPPKHLALKSLAKAKNYVGRPTKSPEDS